MTSPVAVTSASSTDIRPDHRGVRREVASTPTPGDEAPAAGLGTGIGVGGVLCVDHNPALDIGLAAPKTCLGAAVGVGIRKHLANRDAQPNGDVVRRIGIGHVIGQRADLHVAVLRGQPGAHGRLNVGRGNGIHIGPVAGQETSTGGVACGVRTLAGNGIAVLILVLPRPRL